MNNLYFKYNIIKTVSIKKLIDEYIPLSLKFEYEKYSNTHSWIEYQTQDNFIDFNFGNELGELISISLVRYRKFNIIKNNLTLSQYPYYESPIGINISNTSQVQKKPYLDGFYYTIRNSCTVNIYNDAIKIIMQQQTVPTLCIMNNNFGILIDVNLNICAFVLKKITPYEHACLIDHAQSP